MRLHYLLGHIHPGSIKRAIANGHIPGKFITNDILKQNLGACKVCMIAKSKSKSCPKKSFSRISIPTHSLHCNESGPRFETPSGNIGFSLIVNKETLLNDMHLYKKKSECQSHLKDFIAMADNKHSTKVKKIRTDNAKEYIVSKEFNQYL